MLCDETTDAVLIHIGANNITKNLGQSPQQIALEIDGIAIRCRSKGVNTIFISSILTLRNYKHRHLAREGEFFQGVFVLIEITSLLTTTTSTG